MSRVKVKNMHHAKAGRKDEFYTTTSTIEDEVQYYDWKGRSVYCPCDSEDSNFWKYFHSHFTELGLRRLVATHFNAEGPSYKLEYDGHEVVKTPLQGNGDWRSPECMNILHGGEVDTVCTNPPFSLFRVFYQDLVEAGVDYLVIGALHCCTYKSVRPELVSGRAHLGYNWRRFFFRVPESYELASSGKVVDGVKYACVPNACWYTTMESTRRQVLPPETVEYDPAVHQRFSNIDGINVPGYRLIPRGYTGLMGVPISYLPYHDPERFELVDIVADSVITAGVYKSLDGRRTRGNGKSCPPILRVPADSPDASLVDEEGNTCKVCFSRVLIRARAK